MIGIENESNSSMVRLTSHEGRLRANGALFVLVLLALIILNARKDGGDRLRQEPERSSRCMPGYLMQLVKKRRETQLPITMNWLSLPN